MTIAPGAAATLDLECPRCGRGVSRSGAGFACAGCGADYEPAFGVPFLGAYEPADILGLIEIAAAASQRGQLALGRGMVERLDAVCAAYHVAEDKDAFRASHEEANLSYFANRYHEWRAVNALLDGEDLAGRKVLDIGAGQGFDACRLALRGAQVTALEFNPLLAEGGMQGLPDLRWIGGIGHALPFATASFDHVFINAALHHMHDIPATIAEALRVLRPGGLLVTSGDPFRPAAAGPELEYVIFDRHTAVLRGINEQIPRISDILQTLEINRELLEVDLFTEMLYGGASGAGPDLAEWARWDLDRDAAMLKQRSGSVAMRVRLKRAWPHPRAMQRDAVLPASRFAAWLDEPGTVLAQLARLVPREHVDREFPGSPTKFDLLNGWRVAQTTETTRTGYVRARLFVTPGPDSSRSIEVRPAVPGRFTVLVNGIAVGTHSLGDGWTRIAVDLSVAERDKTAVLEIRRDDEPADFDAGCFEVRMPDHFRALRSMARAIVRRLGSRRG